MNVGNHYGKVERPEGGRRLSRSGPVEQWWQGRSVLARSSFGYGPAAEAPTVESWAGRWLHLVIEVDSESRITTYRMLAEEPTGALRTVAARPFQSSPGFYPADAVQPSISLRWLDREGRLARPLWLEVDWFYYTPLLLTDAEVEREVEQLRSRGLRRVNTTGLPTFNDYDRPRAVRIEGPSEVACGDTATWRLSVSRAGNYFVGYRYRVLGVTGSPGPWQEVYERELTLTPRRDQGGYQITAEAQDRWRPHGDRTGPHGWAYPDLRNVTAAADRTIHISCGP